LFRSWEYKEQAAEALKLTAPDLIEHKIIDKIVKEPLGGAHRNHKEAADLLKEAILEELLTLEKIDPDKFLDLRIKKYSPMGYWEG
jgi:acetyl-CoA carboxylase carboxyl transferase subunit alpha